MYPPFALVTFIQFVVPGTWHTTRVLLTLEIPDCMIPNEPYIILVVASALDRIHPRWKTGIGYNTVTMDGRFEQLICRLGHL